MDLLHLSPIIYTYLPDMLIKVGVEKTGERKKSHKVVKVWTFNNVRREVILLLIVCTFNRSS